MSYRSYVNKNRILMYVSAVAIPLLLILATVQARSYEKLKKEVEALEDRQVELVEENRKLISGISVLSSSQRIQKIAEDELGMHRAESDEIVRVEMKNSSK